MKSPPSVCDAHRRDAEDKLRRVQEQFKNFQALLEQNNQVLKVIGDMEEKSQGEYLFDLNYIRASLRDVRKAVREIIEQMIIMGGDRYEPLRRRYAEVETNIARLLPDQRPIERAPFVMPFEVLTKEHALSVGSKNAQLGEMKSRLGLPVPDGFAITAWAYKHFLDASGLQEGIRERVERVDYRRYEDLVRVSNEVQALVSRSRVPQELADEILAAYEQLAHRSGTERVAMRSSGIGEDSLFSFAGQYATLLNVRRSQVVDTYRDIIVSKFTPQAIYYFLSHGLAESELAMSVGCVAMVDAAASGVVYTRDPVHPNDDSVLVHSVFGLGEYLVDGTLTPDVFRVSRSTGDVLEQTIVRKCTRLVMDPAGGTAEEQVAEPLREVASLREDALRKLCRLGILLEEHYGVPQDVEWAVDGQGRPFLLQTRPLRVIEDVPEAPAASRDGLEVLFTGGTTACPGAGCGPVTQVTTNRDLPTVPEGSVVVAPNPFPGLITVMGKARALVTEVGGVASHMATLAREYRMPTLVGVKGATKLEQGRPVTVDATGGAIVAGCQPELVRARASEAAHLFEDTPLFQGFKEILKLVAPLHLLHPSDPSFVPNRCKTLHDITRYAHQKAIEEMFCRVSELEHTAQFGQQLKSELPFPVKVLYVDQAIEQTRGEQLVSEDSIHSRPMAAFWAGMREQGWPSMPVSVGSRLPSALATRDPRRRDESFAEKSYAVLGESYMMLCLHLGYHFTTIEAMCTADVSKNYVRMQYKDGGASLERRVRRIRLVATLLSHLGFENASQADFLDASFAYTDCGTMSEKLRQLGRITMMTKQLDMALSNDAITDWYTRDFLKKLGLGASS